MFFSFLVWLILWFGIMGLPNYFFGKGKTSYWEHPLRNIIWYSFGLLCIFLIYNDFLFAYFTHNQNQIAFLIVCITTFIVWIIFPFFLHKDYYQNYNQRLRYQITKIFDITFQQMCLLSGFLLLDVAWYLFGIIFFLIHIPVPFIIPKRLGIITAAASLPGGIVFGYLISLGPIGFVCGVALHFAFYITIPFVYSFTQIKPVQR